MAESAGELPLCRPPQIGVIEASSSGLSAAEPPPLPPPLGEAFEDRRRLALLGVSQAGRVSSASDPRGAGPGECVSAKGIG